MWFFAPPAMALFIWLFGEIVMHLWNWLLPMLFGWKTISFWQALGLMILCRILFGGHGFGGGSQHRGGRHWGKHWQGVTPEEREKFLAEARRRGTWPPEQAGEAKGPA